MASAVSGTPLERLVEYQNRAEECRILAGEADLAQSRSSFIRVAESYDLLAAFARQEIALGNA
jgi:hypothetical protein